MKLYLAPESSLELTRYLRSTNGEGGLGGTPMRKRMLNDAANTVQELVELDETAQRWLRILVTLFMCLLRPERKGRLPSI